MSDDWAKEEALKTAEAWARDWMSFAFPNANQSRVDQFIERNKGIIKFIKQALLKAEKRGMLRTADLLDSSYITYQAGEMIRKKAEELDKNE